MYRVLWEELRLCAGAILGAWPFCWGVVFRLGFGQRTPRGFSLGLFLGSGVSSLFLSLLPFLLLLLFWGPARVPFPSFSLPVGRIPDYRYLDRRELRAHVLTLFSVSSLCPGRSPFPLSSPSFCPLSLSFLFLSCASVACLVVTISLPLSTHGIPNKHVSSARSAFVPVLCTHGIPDRHVFDCDSSMGSGKWMFFILAGTLDPRVTCPGYGLP